MSWPFDKAIGAPTLISPSRWPRQAHGLGQGRIGVNLGGSAVIPTDNAGLGWDSGGLGGVSSPTAVSNGTVTYIGVVTATGYPAVEVWDNTTRLFVKLVILSTTIHRIDDHLKPSLEITPSNKLLVLYEDHNIAAKVYARLSSDNTIENLGPEVLSQGTSGHDCAYPHIMIQASTGFIFNISRAGGRYIGLWKSTNEWATPATYLGRIAGDSATTGSQVIFSCEWVDPVGSPNRIRIFMAREADTGGGSSKLHCLEVDVSTLDVQSAAGSMGTVGSSPAVMTDCAAIWDPGAGFSGWSPSCTSPTGCLGYYKDEVAGTIDYYWLSLTGTSGGAIKQFTAADWTKTHIVSAGLIFGAEDRPGGATCSGLTTTTPEIYLSRFVSSDGKWHVERWVAGQAAGTTWPKTVTIAIGGAEGGITLFRPRSPKYAAANCPVLYAIGTYADISTWSLAGVQPEAPLLGQTEDLIAQMTTPPTIPAADAQTLLIDTAMRGLNTNGLLSILDLIHLPGSFAVAHDQLLNWPDPANNALTVVGAGDTAIPDVSIAGNGVDSYYASPLHFSAMPHFLQDDACFFCALVTTNATVNNGCMANDTSNVISLTPRNSTNNIQVRLNSTGVITVAGNLDSRGIYIISRKSGVITVYKDGASVGSGAVVGDTAPLNAPFCLGRATSTVFSNKAFAGGGAGGSVTGGQAAALSSILRTLINAITPGSLP